MHIISFPGIGLGPFSIDHTAFTLFTREVRWYGIIIVTGIILAVLYATWRAKQVNISSDDVLDFAIFVVPAGIIGARAYFVLTNLSDYHSFRDVIAVWEGGLAIYGAIIGGAIALVLVAWKKKISLPVFLDCTAPGVMLAQAIGRWGNFCNAEAYGILGKIDLLGNVIETPSLGDSFILRMTIENPVTGRIITVHPTFFYESVWNLLGFILINLFYKKRKFDGEIFLLYLTWYGIGRFFIEGLRGDSLYIGPFRISQLVGLACFIVGIILLPLLAVRAKKHCEALDDYICQFSAEKAEEKPAVSSEKAADSTTDNTVETDTTDNDKGEDDHGDTH